MRADPSKILAKIHRAPRSCPCALPLPPILITNTHVHFLHTQAPQAYVLSSRKDLLTELESRMQDASEQVKALEAVRDKLAESLKAAEEEAAELAKQIQAQQ